MSLDKQGFYAAVAQAAGRPLTNLEESLLDIACDADPHVLRGFEQGWVESLKGRVPEFIPLAEAEARLAEGKIGRWLYDKRSKVWLLNLGLGVHVTLAGVLYGIYNNIKDGACRDESADSYIEQHFGFYVSGAMNMYIPLKAEDYTLLPEEAIFERARGPLKWRGI